MALTMKKKGRVSRLYEGEESLKKGGSVAANVAERARRRASKENPFHQALRRKMQTTKPEGGPAPGRRKKFSETKEGVAAEATRQANEIMARARRQSKVRRDMDVVRDARKK